MEIPEAVNKLLPDTFQGISAVNYIDVTSEGVLNGKIILYSRTPGEYQLSELTLSDLGLPKNVTNDIMANGIQTSTLELVANYNFSIPFCDGMQNAYQESKVQKRNNEYSGPSITVDGQIPFRILVNIRHE